MGRAAGLLLVLLACTACGDPEPAHVQTPASDPRVSLLLEPSQARGSYEVDLADTTPVLIETLFTGNHEALRRAKMELAADGARGIEALRRMVERYRDDPEAVHALHNAAEALALSPEPAAAPILWSLIEHPSESLRMQALRALTTNPRPESFDPVLRALAGASEAYQAEVCLSLAQLDTERAQRLWMGWFEQGDNPHLWPSLLPAMATIRDPELIARAKRLTARDDLGPGAHLWLAAPPAFAGDAEALERLRHARESRNPTERDVAVRALASADLFGELEWTLAHEDYPAIRTIAVRAATLQAGRPDARQLLELAANDLDLGVRQTAWTALALQGDAGAIAKAMELLESSSLGDVQVAVTILARPMDQDPALTERVWESLRRRLESAARGTTRETAELVAILGRVPHREASRALIAMARSTPGDLGSTRAQRQILLQASNAGPVAQDELFELWKSSEDPLLRMDAIEALSSQGGAHGRELLLKILDDPRTQSEETVFVADRLVRIGPASEVAWQIKRAALRLEDPRARKAVHGLLWRWYPAPRS
jgi:HEAT repeat protein